MLCRSIFHWRFSKHLIREFRLRAIHGSLGKRKTVTLIPGDGVWPELLHSVKTLFKEIDAPVDFEQVQLSAQSDNGNDLRSVMESLRRTKVGLKGIIKTPMGNADLNTVNMRMRRMLDLYASVVHARSLPGITVRHGPLDLVIIREQIEGEYSSLEHESVPGVVESLKIMTRRNCERIAKFAFDYAVRNGRSTVTAVHKANIMKLGDGLFLQCCQNVAALYPRVTFNSMIIDNCCMQLVKRPQQFDILVLPNLYGTIVDNLTAGLVGGAGIVPGVSYSHDIALFEPGTRHSYSTALGRDIANPTAILLASCQLLRHINLNEHAVQLELAVRKVIQSRCAQTVDMGGTATTTQFTEAVVNQLKAGLKRI